MEQGEKEKRTIEAGSPREYTALTAPTQFGHGWSIKMQTDSRGRVTVECYEQAPGRGEPFFQSGVRRRKHLTHTKNATWQRTTFPYRSGTLSNWLLLRILLRYHP